MRNWIVAAAVVAMLGAGVLPALAGNTDGGGAQKSDIFKSSHSGTGSDCAPGGSQPVPGFVILNSTGQPGTLKEVVGEIQLHKGPANKMYAVNLQQDSNNCHPIGMFMTDAEGFGHFHVDSPNAAAPSHDWVVLTPMGGGQVLATNSVPLD